MNFPVVASVVMALSYNATSAAFLAPKSEWKKVKVDASVSVYLPADMSIQQLRSAGVYGLQFSNNQIVIDLELGHKNLDVKPTEFISGKKANIVSLKDERDINGIKSKYRVELGIGDVNKEASTLVMKAYVGSESARDIAKQIFRSVEIAQ